jgi:hypothetical protein
MFTYVAVEIPGMHAERSKSVMDHGGALVQATILAFKDPVQLPSSSSQLAPKFTSESEMYSAQFHSQLCHQNCAQKHGAPYPLVKPWPIHETLNPPSLSLANSSRSSAHCKPEKCWSWMELEKRSEAKGGRKFIQTN